VIVLADSLDAEGRGICQAEGLEIRVDRLLVGERARVEIEHRSPHRPLAWARIVERVGAPSPDRVEPPCPAYGDCGGCSLQHLSAAAQRAHKIARVSEALSVDLNFVDAADGLGYRNKGKYVVGFDGDRLVLGAYRPRSHDVIDTIGCRVVEPAIDAMARQVQQVLSTSSLVVHDERRRTGHVRHIVIRSGAEGELLVALVTTSSAPRADLERVAQRLEGAHGVVWVRNDSTSGTVVTDDVEPLAGRETVTERVAGVAIDIGATEFFQVNRRQAQRLYDEVASRVGADSTRRAVDLYCGVGGIAFTLAAAGARVVGIERQPAAVTTAQRAAARAGHSERVQFVTGTAATLADYSDPPPDIVVVNPPRRGLDAETRAAVLASRPGVIAYVSCHPESLARDVEALSEYRLESATVFDLMPGTPQVETLAILRRL
jgi:23S rRNA (uracil1939-C5)-methyltransferase